MTKLNRREFIGQAAAAVGATMVGRAFGQAGASTRPAVAAPLASRTLHAHDVVSLGGTGIRPSRLAIGTGTLGGREQRAMGIDGFVRVFRHGFDEGVRWWDAADSYRTHPHVAAALKDIKRDQVTITSKTRAKDADGVRADIERFRREMNTDYIDIVLLHCMMDGDWPKRLRGAMDALSEAKQKGRVRAVGCSCHTFEALQAAADEPWVEVGLARINPFAEKMDVTKPEDVRRVVEVLETMHDRGKAVYGMKILGEGVFKGEQIDESLRFILGKPFIRGFTIGFSTEKQIDDIARRIEVVSRSL